MAGKLKVTFLSRDANSLGERSSGALVDPVKSFLEIDQLEDLTSRLTSICVRGGKVLCLSSGEISRGIIIDVSVG